MWSKFSFCFEGSILKPKLRTCSSSDLISDYEKWGRKCYYSVLWKRILTDPNIDQQLEFLPFPFHIFWITDGIISASVIPGAQTPTKTHTPFNIWLLGCWFALTYSELSSPFSCPLPPKHAAHTPAVWRAQHLGETRNKVRTWKVMVLICCVVWVA